MELFCFRLHPLTYELDNQDIYWQATTADNLSFLFYKQLQQNTLLFEELTQQYLEDPYAQELHRLRNSEETYPLYLQKRKQKRSSIADAYSTLSEDLLPMDESVQYQEGFDVQTYTIVLATEGVYLGHIYAWISPDGNKLFAMGIRKSIDLILNNNKDIAVAPLLFEGVRMLTLSLGFKQFSIVSPYPHVATMLSRLGFKEETTTYGDIGISPSYYDTDHFEFLEGESRDIYTIYDPTQRFSTEYPNILINHF